MLTHQRQYSCYECPKTFKSQAILNKHVENEHNQTIFFADDVNLPPIVEEVFILGNS